MRKLVFTSFVALGALVGLISAANDDWTTRAVMMGIGALFGAPVGAALARIGRKGLPLKWEREQIPGMGVTSEDLAANYWRDKGRPPLVSALEPEHGRHQFDPDKL